MALCEALARSCFPVTLVCMQYKGPDHSLEMWSLRVNQLPSIIKISHRVYGKKIKVFYDKMGSFLPAFIVDGGKKHKVFSFHPSERIFVDVSLRSVSGLLDKCYSTWCDFLYVARPPLRHWTGCVSHAEYSRSDPYLVLCTCDLWPALITLRIQESWREMSVLKCRHLMMSFLHGDRDHWSIFIGSLWWDCSQWHASFVHELVAGRCFSSWGWGAFGYCIGYKTN